MHQHLKRGQKELRRNEQRGRRHEIVVSRKPTAAHWGFKEEEASGIRFLTDCFSLKIPSLSYSDVGMRPLVPFLIHIVCNFTLFKSLLIALC